MSAKLAGAVLVGITLVGAAACADGQQSGQRFLTSPTPTGPPPGPPGPSATSLAISGQTSSGGANEFGGWLGMVPGEVARLTATARFSDGTERDITADAVWAGDNLTGVMNIVSPGVIQANHPGWTAVTASYGSTRVSSGVRAEVQLRVAPEGVFLLGVAVQDPRSPLQDALVRVTSPGGTFSVSTPFWGIVYLPAVGATAVQVERAGYVADGTSMTVTRDEDVLFTLRPSAQSSAAR
jgi:hypothetical protein